MKISLINKGVIGSNGSNYQKTSFVGIYNEPATMKTSNVSSENLKAYYLVESGKPIVQTNSIEVELNLTEDEIDPNFYVEIKNNKDLKMKQGLRSIYLMVLNDKINSELVKKFKLETTGSIITSDKRALNLQCSQDELEFVLERVEEAFVNLDIDEKYIEEAKRLSLVLFKLSKATGESYPELSDISREMSENEFKELIESISVEDLKKYNSDVLNNSSKKIKLDVNREFYLQNSERIEKTINEWFRANN